MDTIEFFKLQAKNLHRDYKTKFKNPGDDSYSYNPKYFDVDGIVVDFDLDEDNFSLMNAQHVIAYLAGFKKWNELIKASPTGLKLAKLLFDNAHKISIDEWDVYLGQCEDMNNEIFDEEAQLGIFESVFVDSDGHETMFHDYRLSHSPIHVANTEKPKQILKRIPDIQITSLPLSKEDRVEFIETANTVFESVMLRMEPHNPELIRKLWNAQTYVDNELLGEAMLPISKSYALSLIDAFLVHHVLGLVVQADKMSGQA